MCSGWCMSPSAWTTSASASRSLKSIGGVCRPVLSTRIAAFSAGTMSWSLVPIAPGT